MTKRQTLGNAKAQALAMLAPATFPLLIVIGWTCRHFALVAWQREQADLLYSLMFALVPMGGAFALGCAALLASVVYPGIFQLRCTVAYHFVPIVIGGLAYHAPVF